MSEEEEVLGAIIDVFFVVYAVILVAGTMMTLVFLFALVRGRKMLAQWPFYKIVWSMTFMDAIYLTIQVCWAFPEMVADNDIETNSELEESKAWYHHQGTRFVLNLITIIPFKGIIYFSLLMALNRLAVFVNSPISPMFSKLHALFRDYVGWTTLGCWALILTLSVYTELLAPVMKFNRTSLSYETTDSGIIDSPFLYGVNTISDYVIPFVIVVIYIIIYSVIGKNRRLIVGSNTTTSTGATSTTRSRSPDDRKLLFQALIITFFLQLSNVTTVLNAAIEENGWAEYVINILDLITTVFNHSIHSTIFLLSNPTIRSFLPRPTLEGIKRRLRGS